MIVDGVIGNQDQFAAGIEDLIAVLQASPQTPQVAADIAALQQLAAGLES